MPGREYFMLGGKGARSLHTNTDCNCAAVEYDFLRLFGGQTISKCYMLGGKGVRRCLCCWNFSLFLHGLLFTRWYAICFGLCRDAVLACCRAHRMVLARSNLISLLLPCRRWRQGYKPA